MFIIGRFEELAGAFRPNDGCGGENFGREAGAGEPRGHLGLDRIDQEASADGRPGRNGIVQPGNFDHGVADRRASIQDEICHVLQFLAARVLAATGLSMFFTETRFPKP